MAQDRQVMLEKLRAELAFIECGGYRNPARAQWRPQFVFEDSAICLNHDATKRRKPCSECVLAEFVPEGSSTKRIPCRHIPLNQSGETVDSFYRTGTPEELEEALVKWLKTTIDRLEQETAQAGSTEERAVDPAKAKFVPVDKPAGRESLFSICANPECETPFRYGSGRLFRFHKSFGTGEKAPNTHSVQHFWLCGHCCLDFTLEYQDGAGVLIKNRPDVVCRVEIARFIAKA